MTHRETLAAWLQDAYAMEKALIPILENHAKDVEDHPAMHQRLLDHVEETRRQADRLEECLQRIDSSPSTAKSMVGNLFGMMQAPATGMFQDERVKNGLLDFATENFEIAAYEALIVAAESAGELEIAGICRQSLQEERHMADWVHEQLPLLVEEHALKAAVESVRS